MTPGQAFVEKLDNYNKATKELELFGDFQPEEKTTLVSNVAFARFELVLAADKLYEGGRP